MSSLLRAILIISCFLFEINSQSSYSNNLYACILFCSDGKRIISPNCYLSEPECGTALSSLAGECPDLKDLDIFALPFPDTEGNSCSNFIANLLKTSQTDTSLQTKEEIGKASCGCSDMVFSFLQTTLPTSITASSFCSAAVEYYIEKFKMVDVVCGKAAKTGLLNKFCSSLMDESGIISAPLTAFCEFIVSIIEKLLGLNINDFYLKIQSGINSLLNQTSNDVCGMLLCSSTSAGECSEEKYSKGIVAKITDSATNLYCYIERLLFTVLGVVGIWLGASLI